MYMVLEQEDVEKAIEFWLNEQVLSKFRDYKVNFVGRKGSKYEAEIINLATGKKLKALPTQHVKPGM